MLTSTFRYTGAFITACVLSISTLAIAEPTTQLSIAASADSPVAVELESIYQVEFIVVRARNRSDLESENWENIRPSLASDDKTQGAFAVVQPLESTPFFSWVKESQWDLPNTIKRLEQNGNYELLAHRSWRQQATPRNDAIAYITKIPFDDYNQPLAQNAASSYSSGFSSGSFGSNQTQTQANPGLYGTFSFSKARYLHLSVNMLMTETKTDINDAWQSSFNASSTVSKGNGFALAAGDSSEPGDVLGLATLPQKTQRHFHLTETRRIKTEQTHYFDHPGFSVLAHVRRLTPEEMAAYQ